MIISSYQVQSTLRAYGQQLAERNRLSKIKNQKSSGPKDQVILSAESKKKLTAERVAQQILTQFRNGSELNENNREILNRLSQEYGQPLQIEGKEGGGLAFRVSDPTSPGGNQTLSPEETERLKNRLLEISYSIVYNNLG